MKKDLNVFILKSKKDAKYVADNFIEFAKDYFGEYDSLTIREPDSCCYTPSACNVFKKEDGKFYSYYSGQNWRDREPTEIQDIVEFLYKNRKSFNKTRICFIMKK